MMFANRLRGVRKACKKDIRRFQDYECIGGMARAARCVAALPGNIVAGGQIRRILDEFIQDKLATIDACVNALGREVPDAGPSDEDLNDLRGRLARFLQVSDLGPVQIGDCTSPIRAGLLEAWAAKAGDPGAVAAQWVRHGAPAGILADPLLAGVLPLADTTIDEAMDPAELNLDLDGFTNYAGVDLDDEVLAQVEEFVGRGYLKRFDTVEECSAFLGAPLPCLGLA